MSDWLGFESRPYPKSFMSFVQMKDYTYMIIDDGKVSSVSSYIVHIS